MRADPLLVSRHPFRSAGPWLLASLGCLSAAMVWLAAGTAINHDCAVYLNFAAEMLRGRVPYVDVVDLNPPLAAYWCLPPAWAARVTGWSAPVLFHLFVGGLTLVNLAALVALLHRAREAFTGVGSGLIGLAFVAGSLMVLQRGHFGQREHLFAMGYVPFLVCRALRSAGRQPSAWLAGWVGVMAGAVVCLKPTFLAAAMGVEVVLLVMRRRWRPVMGAEVAAAGVVAAAYALHWLVAPAAMREAFFHRWAPLVLEGYAAYDAPWGQVVLRLGGRSMGRWWVLLGAAAMVAAGWIAARRPLVRGERRMLLAGLAALSVLSLSGYLQQHKGWPYHIVPFIFSGVMIVGVLGVEAARAGMHRWGAWFGRAVGAAGLVLTVCLATGVALAAAGRSIPPPPINHPLAGAIERWTDRGDGVLVMSTAIDPGQPLLVQMDRLPASRYSCMYPIPLLLAGGRTASDENADRSWSETSGEERAFLDDLKHDIRQRTPRLIAIDAQDGGQGCPPSFNLLHYLKRNGFFDDAIGGAYDEAGSAGRFRIYVRKGSRVAS